MNTQQEKFFFESSVIKISNIRFVVHGKTYAMSTISSFRVKTEELPQLGRGLIAALSIFGAIIGLVGFTSSNGSKLWGLAGLVVAYFSYKKFNRYGKKWKYTIFITTTGGEVSAFETTDQVDATDIEKALSGALIYRG